MCCLLYLSALTFDCLFFCFFKQKTAYEMRISDWSSDVCSSDLVRSPRRHIVDGTVGAAAQEGREMQSQSKILDDMTKLASSALGVAAGMRSEVEARFREQLERLLTQMDLVPREDRKSTRLNSSH